MSDSIMYLYISMFLISRLLQTNSFSGKMNALNEVNKLLPSLNSIHRSTFNRSDDNEYLTSEKFIVKQKNNLNIFVYLFFIL